MVSACLTFSQSRMLMAGGQPLAAARQLDTLAAEQERGGEWLFAVRLRLIQAVALWRAGERERAITLAIPTRVALFSRNRGAACLMVEKRWPHYWRLSSNAGARRGLQRRAGAASRQIQRCRDLADHQPSGARAASPHRAGAADAGADRRRLLQQRDRAGPGNYGRNREVASQAAVRKAAGQWPDSGGEPGARVAVIQLTPLAGTQGASARLFPQILQRRAAVVSA